jgi:hypothetical protein
MIFGKLLPMHPKPLEDELLSSWWFRLARANFEKLHTFTGFIAPKVAVWNRDIDRSATLEMLEVLATKTGTPLERVKGTTLGNYEGKLFQEFGANGSWRWIMPVGVYHRTRRNYGLQYCPLCLREDPIPYFRRIWRLSFVTVCPRHWLPLHDRCPKCNAPVVFHRRDFNMPRDVLPDHSITLCQNCEMDLRDVKCELRDDQLPVKIRPGFVRRGFANGKQTRSSMALTQLYYYQMWLLEGLETGVFNLDELSNKSIGHRLSRTNRHKNMVAKWGVIPATEYFDVLHIIVALLSTDCGEHIYANVPKKWIGKIPNQRRLAFCQVVRRASGVRRTFTGEARSPLGFDAFPVQERRIVMIMAAYAMQYYPQRLLQLCEQASLTKSRLLRDFEDAPAWFAEVF